MTCPNCGAKNVTKVRYYESGIVNCRYCPEKHIPAPLFMPFVRAALPVGSVGKRTAAHDADISRRKLSPEGKVYRDYGRKFI